MLLTFVIIYLLFTLVAGFFAARYVKSSSDFIQAGRRLHPAMNAAALFALWYGSETIFGASSEFVKHGLSGVIEDPFGAVLCLILFAAFFAKKLYKLNLITLGDLFRNAYGHRVELVSGIFMLITFFGYVAAQMVALSIILNALLPEMSISNGIIICALVVTAYTFVGGMWAVSVTDFIQSIFIVLGLIMLCIFLIEEAGGIRPILQAAPQDFYNFLPDSNAVDITNWIAAWLTLGLGSIPSQDIFQRVNSARSIKAAVYSTYLGALLYLVFALLPLFIALAAHRLYPESGFEKDAQSIIPMLVLNHAPLFVQVLFFGSLLSAVMSTCSGALLAPASILSENLVKPFIKKKISDKQLLWLLRFSVLCISLIAMFIAINQSNIYDLVAQSSILGIVSLLVPMVAALFFKSTRKTGAMLSMLSGMAAYVWFEYYCNLAIAAFLPALGISIIGMLAGYILPK